MNMGRLIETNHVFSETNYMYQVRVMSKGVKRYMVLLFVNDHHDDTFWFSRRDEAVRYARNWLARGWDSEMENAIGPLDDLLNFNW